MYRNLKEQFRSIKVNQITHHCAQLKEFLRNAGVVFALVGLSIRESGSRVIFVDRCDELLEVFTLIVPNLVYRRFF